MDNVAYILCIACIIKNKIIIQIHALFLEPIEVHIRCVVMLSSMLFHAATTATGLMGIAGTEPDDRAEEY